METLPTTHERLIAARREIFNLNTGSNTDLFINNYDNKQAQKIAHKTKTLESAFKSWYDGMKDLSKTVIVANPIASSKL